MKIKVIALCGAILLSGSYDAQAQGFLGKLKGIGKKIEKKVKDEVVNTATETVNKTADKTVNSVTNGKVKTSPMRMKSKSASTNNQSARDKKLNDYATAVLGPDGNRNAEDEAPTVRLPEKHTALLAPLGYDIDSKDGRLSQKPQVPPAKAADQVNWRSNQPAANLDNASMVAEYNILNEAAASGKVDFDLSPAWHYFHMIKDMLYERIHAIEMLPKKIKEAKDEYTMGDDTYNWVINGLHDEIVRILDSGPYKEAIRSSIEPLFTVNMFDDIDATRKYYEEHGGLKDAHKAKFTHWDPNPNKTKVKTSTGQKATVVSSAGKSGSTIDIDGVMYIIHTSQGRALLKESVKTAVKGRDIVIPEKVEHNGVMYPVKEIVASAFENAGIRSVKIPSTVTEIGNAAFRGNNMTEVVIPASVKVVRGSAFNQCPNLTKVVFQAQSMDEIQGCFSLCTKLQSVTFPASLAKDMSYDMFRGCTSLTNVVLPKNLRTIPSHMFAGCKSLTTLNLPTTITKVEDSAFDGCGLTTLYLPNLKEIEEDSFSGCKSLKSLTVNKTIVEKFKEGNYWLYVTNFEDNPNFSLKVNGNTMSLPSSIKVE